MKLQPDGWRLYTFGEYKRTAWSVVWFLLTTVLGWRGVFCMCCCAIAASWSSGDIIRESLPVASFVFPRLIEETEP